MPIYDVSVALSSDTPTYPGDPHIQISQFFDLAKGDPANVSLLHFGAHSGTHVDAPVHFVAGGARVDSLALDTLIGPAQVIEVPTELDTIDAEFVKRNCDGGATRILFKTRNSGFWDDNNRSAFRSDYTSLDAAAASTIFRSRSLAQIPLKHITHCWRRGL
jgi:arylformamidase